MVTEASPVFPPQALRGPVPTVDNETCEEILRTAARGTLSLTGDDGYPYGIPMNFIFEDGRIYFHCAGEGHKIDAIDASDKACFTVLGEGTKNEGEWWLCFTSVVCFGRIRRVTDDDVRRHTLLALGAKYFPEGYDTEGDIAQNWKRVQILELTIEHMSGKAVREK